MMAYEAQIAGVGDNPPGRPGDQKSSRSMQRRSSRDWPTVRPRSSRPSAPSRRSASSTAAAPARFDDRRRTRGDRDRRGLRPLSADPVRRLPGVQRQRALFALPVVRRPEPAWPPCSAAAPGLGRGARRRCRACTCRPDCGWTRRGAGEVQTPPAGGGARQRPRLGDRVCSATPRPASSANASTNCSWSTATWSPPPCPPTEAKAKRPLGLPIRGSSGQSGRPGSAPSQDLRLRPRYPVDDDASQRKRDGAAASCTSG